MEEKKNHIPLKTNEMDATVNTELTSTVEDNDLQVTSGTSPVELETGKMQLKDFLSQGYKFAFLNENNRDISETNITKLKASIGRIKAILRPIEVIPIQQAFDSGLKVFTSQKVELKADSADCQSYYVIVDGQHRAIASTIFLEENKMASIDVPIKQVSIPENITICQYLTELNFTETPWNADDTRKIAANKHEGLGETILSLVDGYSKELKMTQRGLFKIFFLRDAYKKSLYETAAIDKNISGELKGTDEQIKRGKKIITAFRVGFATHEKLIRNSAAIDCFINSYNNVPDESKADGVESLITFFSTLSSEILDKAMTQKTVADKTRCLEQEYLIFQKKWISDKEKLCNLSKAAISDFETRVIKGKSPAKASRTRKEIEIALDKLN